MNLQPAPKTPRATPTNVRSSKRNWIVALTAAIVLASAIPASAISVDVRSNTSTRFSFDVDWEDTTSSSLVARVTAPFIEASDLDMEVRVLATVPLPDVHVDDILVRFNPTYGDRSSQYGRGFIVQGFTGEQILQRSYGLRFVYGTAYPPPHFPHTELPDNGSTALLLGTALFGVTLVRREVVRRGRALLGQADE